MHGSEAERECVLPGCVWSEPRPEELKALNVIIRAVGEPSSNHTQITYTLTPTYNTSHPRAARVRAYVHGLKEEKKGLMGKERKKWKTGRLCASSDYASCVAVKRVCTDKRAATVRATHEQMCVCVCHRGKEKGVFFSPLSSSLSSFYLSVLQYIPPLYFPFLHAAPDVKAVKY